MGGFYIKKEVNNCLFVCYMQKRKKMAEILKLVMLFLSFFLVVTSGGKSIFSCFSHFHIYLINKLSSDFNNIHLFLFHITGTLSRGRTSRTCKSQLDCPSDDCTAHQVPRCNGSHCYCHYPKPSCNSNI